MSFVTSFYDFHIKKYTWNFEFMHISFQRITILRTPPNMGKYKNLKRRLGPLVTHKQIVTSSRTHSNQILQKIKVTHHPQRLAESEWDLYANILLNKEPGCKFLDAPAEACLTLLFIPIIASQSCCYIRAAGWGLRHAEMSCQGKITEVLTVCQIYSTHHKSYLLCWLIILMPAMTFNR